MQNSFALKITAEGKEFILPLEFKCAYCPDLLTGRSFWESTRSEWMCESCYEHPKNYLYATCFEVSKIDPIVV